jgi:hypothetical protein
VRLVLLIAFAGAFACRGNGSVVTDGSAVAGGDLGGGAVYVPCSTLCYRPGDCAVAYPDDDICPSGFRCAYPSGCITDGGAGD